MYETDPYNPRRYSLIQILFKLNSVANKILNRLESKFWLFELWCILMTPSNDISLLQKYVLNMASENILVKPKSNIIPRLQNSVEHLHVLINDLESRSWTYEIY